MSKLSDLIPEAAKRNYKDEYKKFQSSTKAKKYRAELNKYNRKKGTYGNGDGKDASHKNGKIVGFEAQSKNRGRAEKSRLKKEVRKSEKIQVPGIGVYTWDTLTSKVQSMAKDLSVNAKRGNWNKSSRNGIRAFAEMWNALAEYDK
tara:strand:- start:70 stop:507 length:438 start_codon:yes stop_codon:yes gene_type:complete